MPGIVYAFYYYHRVADRLRQDADAAQDENSNI